MPNDEANGADVRQGAAVAKKVLGTLVDTPAYALLYGVVFLLFLVSAGMGVASIGEESPLVRLAPLGALLLALVVAFVAVLYLEPKRQQLLASRSQGGAIEAARRPASEGADPLAQRASQIEEGLRAGLELAPRPIRDHLQRTSEEWADVAQKAGQGKMRASESRYTQILLEMYESASSSVFSTSIRDFLVGWGDTHFSDRILAAHGASTATVTRVFVFEGLDEVDADSRAVMEQQQKTGKITVRVYVNNLDPAFSFNPEDGRKDFTIIDDRYCAFTAEYGPGKFTADWYFAEGSRLKRAREIREALTKGSLPLDEFLQRYPSPELSRAG